jgi:PAS domain S-box-containing protein
VNKNESDKYFLDKLNIIYIEDNNHIRERTKNALDSLVQNIYTSDSCSAGLKLYKELKKSNKRIDAIITVLEMPKMNGVDLLKEIRLENKNIPILFISENMKNEHLVELINYKISAYLTKPFDIKILLDKLSESCHEYHQNELIIKQKEELDSYLSAIDNVAIISKTDISGVITFANDFFCELSEYKREELIGKPHNVIRHPENSKELFSNLWQTIKEGNIWNGKIKNLGKNGNIYYVNTTIIPIYDDLGIEIIEYIAIRFLTTQEELSKREFRKKVIDNIQQSKKKEFKYIKKIAELENYLNIYNNKTSIDEIEVLNKRNRNLISQIEQYENEIKEMRFSSEKLIKTTNEKVKNHFAISSQLGNTNQRNSKIIKDLENEILLKKKAIESLQFSNAEKIKYIDDLKDVISAYEKKYDIKNLGMMKKF